MKSSDNIVSPQQFPHPLTALRGTLRHNEPMSKHTTWRVGGPAEWFYEPADLEDLAYFISQLSQDVPLFWLGLGSNLLVRDRGIRGVVVLTAGLLNQLEWLDTGVLKAGAGISCAKLARSSVQQGCGGIEFLAGIPGTLGGALTMNAGAFGGETWSLIDTVETLDNVGNLRQRTSKEYEIGYRHVNMPPDEWFVSATFKLGTTVDTQNQNKIRELLAKRNQTQPIGLPSCGSVFRNPQGNYAARLIEDLGWKGYRLGGACVSEKHANFIINEHQATATDIECLIEKIQQSIEKATGVCLIPEVRIIGEFVGKRE